MNIKEAALLFDLTVDTLRYYEKIGVVPPVKRSQSGYRMYRTKDLNWLYLVKNLRKAGLSINSLVEFCRLSQLGSTEEVELMQKQILADQLTDLETKLADMERAKALLTYKLATYDQHIAKFKTGELTDDTIEPLWEQVDQDTCEA